MADNALAQIEPRPGVAKPDAVLKAKGVRRQFGGLVAVDVEHLEVQRGVDHRADRAQRCGQDDVLQRVDRLRPAEVGGHGVRRHPDQRLAGLAPHRPPGMVRTFQLTKALAR